MDRGEAIGRLSRAAYSLSASDGRLRGRATRVRGAVSMTHARALRVLAEQGPLSVRALAECAETTAPATTQLVNGLVDAGYVTREVDPANRRAVIVTITEAGLARHREREATIEAAFERELGHLGVAELAAAAEVMRRLAIVYDEL